MGFLALLHVRQHALCYSSQGRASCEECYTQYFVSLGLPGLFLNLGLAGFDCKLALLIYVVIASICKLRHL